MPVLTLYGIPRNLRDRPQLLDELVDVWLPEAVASIPEMKITTSQVTVFIPDDLRTRRPRTKLIVFIEGLWMREERTPEVRQRLADAVRDCLEEFVLTFLPECELIEVIPRSQRPGDGFAQWRRNEEDDRSADEDDDSLVTDAAPLAEIEHGRRHGMY